MMLMMMMMLAWSNYLEIKIREQQLEAYLVSEQEVGGRKYRVGVSHEEDHSDLRGTI